MAVCARPGCPVIVPRGYCAAHRPTYERYDRDTPHAKVLRSNRWRLYSQRYLRQHPLCVLCERSGLVTASACVDHIMPMSKGGSVWHPDNHQALCWSCNARKGSRHSGGGVGREADAVLYGWA